MQQVLFRLPIHFGGWLPDGIPLYGYGLMLFLAYVCVSWLIGKLAAKNGVSSQLVQDMALLMFLVGILGARIAHMIVFHVPFWEFFRIWDGGLIFYGSAFGGLAGYIFIYYVYLRKKSISSWKIADIAAPGIALGIGLGRLGCFLNGCCYGNVACPDGFCPQVHFPLSAPPRFDLVRKGWQTSAGFVLSSQAPDGLTVAALDAGSPAAAAGLHVGDRIVKADDHPMEHYGDLESYLTVNWPRGKNDLALTVRRGEQEIDLPAFAPRTIGLHPTQVYSSMGGFILLLVTLAYWPLRQKDGAVMAVLLLTYPIERFFEEALRNDTEVFRGGSWWPAMTLSQNISVFMFLGGLFLLYVLHFRPPRQPVEEPAQLIPQAVAS